MKRLILIIVIATMIPFMSQAQNYRDKRSRMVKQQIVYRGIDDPTVVRAMREVERHQYVPEQYRDLAYDDRPLPIGQDQTISQPYIVALMTDLLDIEQGDKVLEIGTGSGYQAAVLSTITSEVYTIEIIEELAKNAKNTLLKQGYQNIHFKVGDGYIGWKEFAPFNAIIVTCAPSDIPQPLKQQLAEGGRMVIPVGGQFIQKLVLVKKENGELKKQEISAVRFVPMINKDGERH